MFYINYICCVILIFFFSSRRRHTRCALVTGVQTCALPIFRRYAGSQVYIFDKGYSARAAVLAMGGEHHALGSDGSLAFQPLRGIADPAERSWAAEWIGTLLKHEKCVVTPEVKESVWSTLTNLASAPVAARKPPGTSVLLH